MWLIISPRCKSKDQTSRSMISERWYSPEGHYIQSMVCQPSELHGEWKYTSRRRQEEADTPQQISPLGWPLSTQGLCWWFTPPLYPALWDPKNSRALSLLALWRTLRSNPYPSKSLVEWFLLAKHVWRCQRIRLALPKMLEAREQCEYILVAVDYMSKWVEALSCIPADMKSSKRMF